MDNQRDKHVRNTSWERKRIHCWVCSNHWENTGKPSMREIDSDWIDKNKWNKTRMVKRIELKSKRCKAKASSTQYAHWQFNNNNHNAKVVECSKLFGICIFNSMPCCITCIMIAIFKLKNARLERQHSINVIVWNISYSEWCVFI